MADPGDGGPPGRRVGTITKSEQDFIVLYKYKTDTETENRGFTTTKTETDLKK